MLVLNFRDLEVRTVLAMGRRLKISGKLLAKGFLQ